jgi:hypothetical protein
MCYNELVAVAIKGKTVRSLLLRVRPQRCRFRYIFEWHVEPRHDVNDVNGVVRQR